MTTIDSGPIRERQTGAYKKDTNLIPGSKYDDDVFDSGRGRTDQLDSPGEGGGASRDSFDDGFDAVGIVEENKRNQNALGNSENNFKF
jgi:hypothetical protein